MTAATTLRTGNTLEVKTPMLAFLQGLHERWLREVRGILDPARQDGAGLWIRWRAIQYLESGFARRFERERRACQQVEDALGPVRWGKVSPESHHLFEVISEDDLVQGC